MTSNTDEFYTRRNTLLKDIDHKSVRQAWFTFSHLLLNENARVVHMGCGDGEQTFIMAVMNPDIRFVGLDKNKRHINKAKEMYQDKVPNLEFVHGDVTNPDFPEKSVDAVINSYILHKVFSNSKYNPLIVSMTLANHFKMLKVGGTMFIRDYARPPPEEYVLMEMPDVPSNGDSISTMSETDLLLWFSENARPKYDAGCGGFFLEELPPRIPRTRLFRLPYKWAYEFIMRKDEREKWERDLPIEYTFFTMREFRKELRNSGARVQYSGPFWDEDMINEHFEGHFRLYDDESKPLGNPPTCFIAVSQKMSDRQSLHLLERRAGSSESSALKVMAMRNEHTGDIVDVISREKTYGELIPFAIDEEERLKIYLHDGITRPVANTVPRNGLNIDDKRWSGHTIEPVSIEAQKFFDLGPEPSHAATVRFARDMVGLMPKEGAGLIHGPDYYPAPDYIDDRIYTYYMNVARTKEHISPKTLPDDCGRFQGKGVIREFDAQQVLNAIAVGLIPNARLELQILSLFEHLELKAENWTTKDFKIKSSEIKSKTNIPDLLQSITEENKKFKEIRGNAGQLRVINATFVEEGQAQGAPAGLAAQDLDFVISDEKTLNTAVVIPITKDQKEELHAGFVVETMPVPQRHEGNGETIRGQCFNIPPEVKTIKQLRSFIAQEMKVEPHTVVRLGESYYNHIGVTPQKIFPFAVVAPVSAFNPATTKFVPIHQYRLLWSALSKDTHFMVTLARAYKYFSDDIKMDHRMKVQQIVKERFEGKRPDWAIPMSYISPPGKVTPKAAEKIMVLGDDPAPPQREPANVDELKASVVVPEELKAAANFQAETKKSSALDAIKEGMKSMSFHEKLIEEEQEQDQKEKEKASVTTDADNLDPALMDEETKRKLEEKKRRVRENAASLSPLTDEFSELRDIARAVEDKIDHHPQHRPEKW